MAPGRFVRSAAATIVCVVFATVTDAAEIRAVDVGMVIEGKIEPGDHEKFLSAILCPETYANDCPRMVHLFSPGGDLAEAIKIGRLVRQLKLDTVVPSRDNSTLTADLPVPRDPKTNYMCASACFFIFVAGTYRITFGSQPILGIHRPYLSDTDLKTLSANQAIASSTQARATVEAYLREMGVPTKYADLMFSIPKDQVRWISSAAFDADFYGFFPELKDWVDARCNGIKDAEKLVECWEALKFPLRKEGWQQLAPLMAKLRNAEREEYEARRDVMCALHEGRWPNEFAAALAVAVPNEPSAAAVLDLADKAALCHQQDLRENAIRTLAERGDAASQGLLGIMYSYRAQNIDRDKAAAAQHMGEGVKWLVRASEQGDGRAQDSLAMSYMLGDGVSQDYVQAYKWCTLQMSKSSKSDLDLRICSRDLIASKMSQEQIGEAERLAREWKPRLER